MRLSALSILAICGALLAACASPTPSPRSPTPTVAPSASPSPLPTATTLAVATATPSPTYAPSVTTLPSDVAPLPEGQLVFDCGSGDEDQTYILRPDRTVSQVTHVAHHAILPTLSLDGTRIAYVTGFLTPEIHLIDVDGSGEISLVKSASYPQWSADSRYITFLSFQGLKSSLERINADGTGRESLYTLDEGVHIYGFSMSPDGKQMATTSDLGSGFQGDIIFFDLPSGGHSLFKNLAQDPVWSPDGGKIAFAMADPKLTSFDIYIANSDGSQQVRLTDNPADDLYPAWSPDGKYIAFWSARDEPPEIYVMRADGSQQVKVTNGGGGRPNWGPSPQP